MKALAMLLASLALTTDPTPSARGERGAPTVVVARVDTPIHPASANYLKKVLDGAEKE
jgi:membrane-bound ClpP family serine protease